MTGRSTKCKWHLLDESVAWRAFLHLWNWNEKTRMTSEEYNLKSKRTKRKENLHFTKTHTTKEKLPFRSITCRSFPPNYTNFNLLLGLPLQVDDAFKINTCQRVWCYSISNIRYEYKSIPYVVCMFHIRRTGTLFTFTFSVFLLRFFLFSSPHPHSISMYIIFYIRVWNEWNYIVIQLKIRY